jgi:hypothetical protein
VSNARAAPWSLDVRGCEQVSWLVGVASALEYMHDVVGVGHGNLSGANVLVDGMGRVKVKRRRETTTRDDYRGKRQRQEGTTLF